MKIVSLIASATEIVCALGCEEQLVGRSHECDYPSSVLDLPACSSPKIDVKASSLDIDRQVKEVVEKSLAVYNVDADKLKSLKPDVIVTQDQCEVCAVSLKDVEKAVCDWLEARPEIVSLKPNSLADMWKDIAKVAGVLDHPERGKELIDHLQKRMQAIAQKCEAVNQSRTIACIEWFEPLMVAGNWVPELVAMLGARDLFGKPGEHSPYITWDDLIREDPDVIITMPCGWDIPRSRQEIYPLTEHPVWPKLKAVQQGRVFITDGNQYFNRPGPRLVESLEILAEILYPRLFNFGHKDSAWQKF